MPRTTATTFGAVALMRSLMWSSPLTTYLSLHGVPEFTGLTQFLMISVNPMSLPLIVIVTARVLPSSARNCGGGFGDGLTLCGDVMSLVCAPLQLTSRKAAKCRCGATRCG